MHLYQFENKLFMATHIKPVTEHVASYHQRDQYHIAQLPDDTMVEINGKVSDIAELAKKYQRQAKKEGYTITKTTSIYLKNAKAILIDTVLSPTNHQKITILETQAEPFDYSKIAVFQ